MSRQYSALSGVAIALIVLNHAIHFGLQLSPVDGAWLNALIFLQALGAFAVPAFLFISGAFLSYAARELSFAFVRSSIERILWPYVIWSSIFYAVVFLTARESYSLAGYVKNLLVGYPYHFVPLLIFWYAAAPVAVRLSRQHGVLLLASIGLYQVFLLGLRFPGMLGAIGSLPDWSDQLRPPVLFMSMSDWAVYFPLGLVLATHDRTLKARLIRFRWWAAAVAVALFALGILDAFQVISSPWARFAAPVPVMLLLPTVKRESIPFFRRLENAGRRSYGIYLTHFVVINVLAFVLGRSVLGLDKFPILIFPTLLVFTLGLTLLLMNLMTRPPSVRRLYRYVFGIVPANSRVVASAGLRPVGSSQ